MTEKPHPRLSHDEVDEFARKLQHFGRSLTSSERSFMWEILAHAATSGGQPIKYDAERLPEFLRALQKAYAEGPPRPAPPDWF